MSPLRDQALTHGTWAHERGGSSYQRLEFFGDAILQFLVSELLYARLPVDEGELTRMRSRLVRKETLAEVARLEGLVPRMGSNQAPSEKVLSDVFEATVAAIYLEEGIEAARAFVTRCLEPFLATAGEKDPKTRLQEHCQQTRGGQVPRYLDLGTEGPQHAPTHRSAVLIDGEERGRGAGRSKDEAEQQAASQALQALGLQDRPAGPSATG